MIPIQVARIASPKKTHLLQRLGEAMRRHASLIQALQWVVVLFYLALVLLPVFLPLPPQGASILNSLTLFAQFLFWGIWWPFVILSVFLLGRIWCGVLCPEGALSELASKHGLGKAIPRWLRWSGWPTVAFIITTVYGQLVSVYEYPQAALLILGGSTVAAIIVGYVYGKNKRVWCRYLCPVSGVFGLLAKVAPLHFSVNESAWREFSGGTERVNCAPLIDMRHMSSASKCHSCGRCSGHRDAIALEARWPSHEILTATPRDASTPDAILLMYGMLGVAMAAFQWSASPWFVALKALAADWLIAHDSFTLLQDNAPWWLLTHYPAAADVFTWLDGLCILAYIGTMTLLLGSLTLVCMYGAAKLADGIDWRHLTMALIPLAGLGVFLGLSMMTTTHLRAEGVTLDWVGPTRAILLSIALGWSGWLGWRLLWCQQAHRLASVAACVLFGVPMFAVWACWYLLFFVW